MSGRWEQRARESAARPLATDPERLEVIPLAIRDKREVYACASPRGRVVAKCYADPVVAAACRRALQLVGGRHGPLLVPRCLHYDPERHVVVQDHLPGDPFISLLDGTDAPVAVRRAARALARLHALPCRFDAARARADVVAEARAAAPTVPARDVRRAAAALEWAQRSLEGVPEMPYVACHGDFGWAQLLDCDGAVGVVDFDRAAQAEPAFDVGNLVAQLVRRRGAAGCLLAEALIAEYERHAGWAVRELVFPYAELVLVRKLGRLSPDKQRRLRAALSIIEDARHGR